MRFDVISLFPDLLKEAFNYGITGRALQNKKVILNTFNPREFSQDQNSKVDDPPYGGGSGMVMQVEPMISAIQEAKKKSTNPYVILLSPQGKTFNQNKAEEFSKLDHLVLVCGRYEGLDQRIIDSEVDEECSVGEYILSGGEIPALTIMDSVTRVIEGVVGDPASIKYDTFSDGLLKYPQYTRPKTSQYGDVPEVLLSGDHKLIKRWRLKQSLLKTKKNRPELLNRRKFNSEEQELMEEINREQKT